MYRFPQYFLHFLGGLLVAGGALHQDGIAEEVVHFNQDIRPILSNHCFQCHGPDEANREADLRLDEGGAEGLEELVDRITTTDPDSRMPPADSHKDLSSDQIDLLKQWIEQGAPYEQHWAFVPLKETLPPSPKNARGARQPIDRFAQQKLEQENLQPNGPADKRTLIRRVTFDLTGLPPTPQEIHTFLADDTDTAYEDLVDRLLDRPQYGEHLARYWLDLVRFADTNGMHHDHYREMTPYRDWVIRAFNNNLPFDEFVIDQIAGDLHLDPTTDQQIASGFNRLHLIIDRGTALPEESFTKNVIDRVSAVGTAFLGLTLQCAVCHDHKYDPITQKEFYQFYAFFNNLDADPETGFRDGTDFTRGLQPPYIEFPTAQQTSQLEKLNSAIAELTSEVKTLTEAMEASQAKQKAIEEKEKEKATGEGNESKEHEAEQSSESKRLAQGKAKLQQLNLDRNALLESIPATLVMKERREVRPTHVLVRGVYDNPGEEVLRDTPAFLPPMPSDGETKSRMDLARWLTDPSHPLTARVTVNRFWQQFFGVGLVKTSEDFGAQGEPPSHPELLDHLAYRFIESGWDVKSLVRLIVLSDSYQQSSHGTAEQYRSDPENRLLVRGSRFRMDAEMIRDQILSVTGLLSPAMYGKSINTPQPEGLWEIVNMPNSYPRVFKADTGEKIYRRSLYTFWKRGLPPPQLTIFNAPSRESCIARRERTNTPLQALLLMNEEQYFRAAMYRARTLLRSKGQDDNDRIRVLFEEMTSHQPSDQALADLLETLNGFRSLYRDDKSLCDELLAEHDVSGEESDSTPPVELASWTMLVHSLLNLDQTKTRE